MSAWDKQEGGDHYKTEGLQPLEICYRNFGYEGLRASVYTKVLKYLRRDKVAHDENMRKAIHCIEIQLEAFREELENTPEAIIGDQILGDDGPDDGGAS